MNYVYRVIDANVNRAAEGLRVLEEWARFYCNDPNTTEIIKKLRHDIRKNTICSDKCLKARDSQKDVGLSVSKKLPVDQRKSHSELVPANFKRVQEALRTIEEYLKVLEEYDAAKFFEGLRFKVYSLEKEFPSKPNLELKRCKLEADLYCITSEEHSQGRDNIQVVKEMVDAGIKIIQYREKEKTLLEKYRECLKIREITKEAGVTFIVNDQVDLAVVVEADGVHIGQDDIPIERVREIVGEETIIGLSTHSPEQAHDAVKRGADYIGVGPIFRTFTKKDVCEPVGLEYLDYVVENLQVPFVAIGGIKEHNFHEVVSRGANCIALVTEIVGAESIEAKIKNLRQIMKECRKDV